MSPRWKILIVDDDRDLLRGLGIQLRAAGYEVEVATGAGAVVGAAVQGEPDLILLDLGLPDGDGMAVLARLQAIVSTAGIPVVVITARDMFHAQKAFDTGAVAFLQKPVDVAELMSTINMALERSEALSR